MNKNNFIFHFNNYFQHECFIILTEYIFIILAFIEIDKISDTSFEPFQYQDSVNDIYL